MIFYILLTISTLIISLLIFILWSRTKNLSFVLGGAFLYFWSLYGAWIIIYNKITESNIFQYQYLEEKLFPIYLDYYYFFTLLIYSLFIWIVLGILLLFVKRPRLIENQKILSVSHSKLILMSIVAGALSFFIVAPDISRALQIVKSVYHIINRGSLFYSLHQILNYISLFALALGLAIFSSQQAPRFVTGKKNKLILLSYLIVLGATLIFNFLLGNKHVVLNVFIFGFLFYLVNHKRPRTALLVLVIIISLLFLGFIDVSRGFFLKDIFSNETFNNFSKSFISLVMSNEAFASHFSLYGVLSQSVPLTPGASFISFLASAIPHFLWPNRPSGIYQYYAEEVGATPGIGYTIHHVTGWFLNFGILGVVISALALGLVWSWLFNKFYLLHKYRSLLYRSFLVVAPWAFVGNLPSLIRAGIEGYKGLILEAFIVPTIIFFLAAARFRLRTRTSRIGGGIN